MPQARLQTTDNLLICTACGTQYESTAETGQDECRICEDPRQYVPGSGQTWTTLAELRSKGHKNVIQPSKLEDDVWEIWTEPKVGIGQRACLIKTEHGNMLWDLVAFLDEKTVEEITQLGGIKLIVISHPHFYTTWADWSRTFKCPVYISVVDSSWANRIKSPPAGATLKLLDETYTEVMPGVTAAICGGHFEGSMILHSKQHQSLFVADTIFAVPSSHNPDPTKPGVLSYSFLWSIPNMIPLGPKDILTIWRTLKVFDFKRTYGVMAVITNVAERDGQKVSLKSRILESAKICVRHMGHDESQEIFAEAI